MQTPNSDIVPDRNRIAYTEDFRRKKRNLLTVSALSLLFSISKTGESLSLPGQSISIVIPSFLFGVFLLLWTVYTYFEYEHELSHIRRSYSAWALEVEKSGDVKSAIEDIAASLKKMSSNAEEVIKVQDFIGIAKAKSYFEIYSNAISRDIDKLLQSTLIRYVMERDFHSEEDIEKVEKLREDITKNIDAIKINVESLKNQFSEADQYLSNYRNSSASLRDMTFDEMKKYCDEKIPSALELNKLHGDIAIFDRRMFRIHEQAIPRYLSVASMVIILFDLAIKIANSGWGVI